MTKTPKLYVILAADTEDNHPSYVPGWWRYGSDYDKNPMGLRLDWLKHSDSLLNCFEFGDTRFKVTWFLRTDLSVGDRCLNAMDKLITRVVEVDDELAIHIHTIHQDKRSRWVQCLDQEVCRAIVSESLDIFKDRMNVVPDSARMGWNYMSNAVMQQLENEGVLYDASCIPGMHSQLMYGQRDNYYDWSKAPTSPFHPSYQDYQVPGTMKILEIPVTAYGNTDRAKERNVFPNWVKAVSSLRRLTSIGATLSEFPLISPARKLLFHNDFLIFSAWRNNSDIDKLISSKLLEARMNGWSYVLGYFHPSELLNPISGKPNSEYLRNLRSALQKFVTLHDEVDVEPVTLREFGRAYQGNVAK